MAPDTQSDRTTVYPPPPGRSSFTPLSLALLVTLVNAAKPVTIDDTAYLAFGRQIASHPLDPYGFTLFWWTVPDPAFEVLAPPVVPYWLAAGISLVGEHIALLKLWMFPFVWLLAWSLRELLRHFAPATEGRVLPLLVLSPAVLPTVNLMLDVPALALSLLAVVLLIRATTRCSCGLALAAGGVAGLAMQTKYTALLIPPVLAWYGLTQARLRVAAASGAVAVLLFGAWELLLVEQYGQSHFVYHATAQQTGESFTGRLAEKFVWLTPALVGQLGGLGIGVGLVAGAACGVLRRWLAFLAAIWAVGFAIIAFLPAPPDSRVVMGFWQFFGALTLLALAACAALLTVRLRKGLSVRMNPDTLFLVGWVLLELAGYYALTPFGAARRVIGLTLVGGLLAARATSRMHRCHPDSVPPHWMLGLGIAAGFAVAAIDTLDAYPEKVCAEQAAKWAADLPPNASMWFAGHWGFQYYCERAGMRHIVPGESVFRSGDILVLPAYPDDRGFYRPHIGSVPVRPPADVVRGIAEITWLDPLSAQTVPNFYAGAVPVVCRDHPRLRVVVYAVEREWAVPRR